MSWSTALLSMVVATLGLSPPLDLDLPPSPRPPAPPPKPPGKREIAVIRENVPRVAKLTAALDALPNLSRASVEKVLGRPLGDPVSSPDGYLEYHGELPDGPFRNVFFRHAARPGMERSFILVLGLRDGLYLKPSDFDASLIGPPGAYNPNEAGGKTVIHVRDRPGQKRHFIFRLATEALVSVAFYRGAATHLW